jgi:hypothetical protein
VVASMLLRVFSHLFFFLASSNTLHPSPVKRTGGQVLLTLQLCFEAEHQLWFMEWVQILYRLDGKLHGYTLRLG